MWVLSFLVLTHAKYVFIQADCVNLSLRYLAEARHAIYLGNRDEEQINGLHRKTQRKSFNKAPNHGAKGGRITSTSGGSGKCCICFDPVALQNVSVIAFFCAHAYHVTCLAESSDYPNMEISRTKMDNSLLNSNKLPESMKSSSYENGDIHSEYSERSNIRCILCTTAAASARKSS